MRRAVALLAAVLLPLVWLKPALAQSKAQRLRQLHGELLQQRRNLRTCHVLSDPLAAATCARARYLIPRIKRDIRYLVRVLRRERRERREHREQQRIKRVRHRLVFTARRYLGVPYVWGGTTPRGFDCSGLVQYVYRRALGIRLGRTTFAQLGEGMHVRRLEPGDVVFTRGGEHEGMYIGGGAVIHSPHTGDVVRITSLSIFRSEGYAGARRFAS